jgi:hypothetical protein
MVFRVTFEKVVRMKKERGSVLKTKAIYIFSSGTDL